MDEMTAVRELLHADVTESPHGMAAARARLDGAIAGHRPGRRRMAYRLRWPLARTEVLAAAAVVVVALGSAFALRGPAGERPPARTAPPSAQELLLSAAERAEQAPAATGRYWHVKQVHYAKARVPAGYQMTEATVIEDWKGEEIWWGTLRPGARPSTPADEAAWRADGSPTEWRVADAETWRAAPDEPKLLKVPNGGTYLGESEVTLAEIRQLPADPDQLRAWLERRVLGKDGILFGVVRNLLATTPVSPAVRAAAFRILAAIPGVRVEGEVRDNLGRAGTRVVYERPDGHVVDMVLDPAGPRILASRATSAPSPQHRFPQGLVLDTLYLTAEWTDAEPSQPTAP